MTQKAPGKSHREGITLVQLMDMFPDEATATKWFEKVVWNGTRCCGHCGSTRTSEVPSAKPMPYWCYGLPAPTSASAPAPPSRIRERRSASGQSPFTWN